MTENSYATDLGALMTLEAVGPMRFRGARNDRNDNDRVFGGQLLGQAMMAAFTTVAPGRLPTVIQGSFLAGARPERAIDYDVTVLQEGKRFSNRHVIGSQASKAVLSANITFQEPIEQQRHQVPSELAGTPETARPISDLKPESLVKLGYSGYLSLQSHPTIDCRFVDPQADLMPAGPGTAIRMWTRISHPLGADPRIHACALAYLSDWWVNFIGIAPYLDEAGAAGLYVASLNHTLWFHAPCRADDWLYFVTESPWANEGRGLTLGRLFRRDGLLVASLAQEALQTIRASPLA